MSAPNAHDNQGALSGVQIAFLILAGFFILVALAVTFVFSKQPVDDGEADTRIEAVAKLSEGPAVAANAGKRSGEELYNAACIACHGSGAMGAPKTHEKGAWSARLGGNLKALVASAKKGKGAMPPMGGAADATDEELSKAIAYMMK